MKSILFFISTLLCINISYAQLEKKFHNSGELMSEGKMVDGKMEGKWQYYYKNGKIKKIAHYKNNELNGTFVSYYENGMLQSKGNFKEGKGDGEVLGYFEDGSLMIKSTFNAAGRPVGEFILYHKSKKLERKGTYENGEEVGVWLENAFYSNGNLMYERKLLDGKKNGLCKDYYENGQLSSIGIMANDERNGEYKTYYRNGQLKGVGNYKMGIRHGAYKEYDEDGALESFKTYTNGKRSGNWKFYVDGNLYVEREFLNDKQVKSTKYLLYGNDVGQRLYKVIFRNECKKDIDVAIRGVNRKTNAWESEGWYRIASGDGGYILKTKHSTIYYHVRNKSFSSRGNYKKSFEGKTYDFTKQDISPGGYGKKEITFYCR